MGNKTEKDCLSHKNNSVFLVLFHPFGSLVGPLGPSLRTSLRSVWLQATSTLEGCPERRDLPVGRHIGSWPSGPSSVTTFPVELPTCRDPTLPCLARRAYRDWWNLEH